MRIILFNHFHRGDLFTHKEFARHLKTLLPQFTFEYWHYNHPKVNQDLQIPLTNMPAYLDNKIPFYEKDNSIAINTWIGVWNEIFAKHGGVNMQSLYESWDKIFFKLGVSLHHNYEEYLPTIDYSFFNTSNIDTYLSNTQRKKILICNGKPMSNQSFDSDMTILINNIAKKNLNIDFICTKKIFSVLDNVKFTDDIIRDTEEFQTEVHPYWHDRPVNNCDLNEISYLSTKCDAIIGKNSGPFVFCETKSNLKDPSKIIVSFSNAKNESMSNNIDVKCNYKLVTDHSADNIEKTFEWVVDTL